jgi:hypothetical protein
MEVSALLGHPRVPSPVTVCASIHSVLHFRVHVQEFASRYQNDRLQE